MKISHVFLTLSCLLLFVGAGYCQEITFTANDNKSVVKEMEKEHARMRKNAKDAMKEDHLRGYWDDGDTLAASVFMTSLQYPKERAALSISDEHYQEILTQMRDARDSMGKLSENPEYQDAKRDLDAVWIEATGMPSGSNAAFLEQDVDKGVLDKIRESETRIELVRQEFDAEVEQCRADAVHSVLTPELKTKLLEARLRDMMLNGEKMPQLVTLCQFEALNLNDTQIRQMKQIRDELAPEFEECIELRIEHTLTMQDEINTRLQRLDQSGKIERGKVEEAMKAIMKELEEDPEFKKILEEAQSSARAFTAQVKARMFNILTDKQRSRLQDLIDHPPLYVRIHAQRYEELLGESMGVNEEGKSTKAESDKDVWVPGPDSWRPGDPIPEAYRQERNTGKTFPREEN